ncbi:MAG: metallophosphoesterase family protein [Lachnospiraceae bacterium]|nr:metallophosphoesterase family protein [Lachnospiraceae bacterium]
MRKQTIITSVLVGALAVGGLQAWAATVHYNDSSVTGGSEAWNAWAAEWEKTAADFTKVSLTPGAAESQINFAWYSEGSNATPIVYFGTDAQNLQAYNGTSAAVDASLTNGKAYSYNYATVTGLTENTTYYYAVSKSGVPSATETFKTGDFDSVNILYVGDPQVGASKGQPQGEGKLTADAGVANTAARNDGFAWDRTLDAALAQNPNLNFVISAGDQVNKTGKAKEEEYAAYLSASALTSLPVATTIGNHDSLNPDYSYHFNNPNPTQLGKTQAGGDYYYTYGEGLFIVLNTNNYNVAEHEQSIQKAIAAFPNANWRVVTIHQDIYGSGLDHSDTDGMILRTQLTPVFDKYDIDVVLQGHDHTYSRSKILYGDGQTHGNYEFKLNAAGDDYDWDHAYNTTSGESIPLSPDAADSAAVAALDRFAEDNHCYTIESSGQSTVTNPKGTLYMTANSASGSKYYELIATQQDYIANRSQNWLPSYSVINMTANDFKITTYQVTDAGSVEKIDNTFTIHKTAGR